MKAILTFSIFLAVLVSNVEFEPSSKIKRQKRAIFDIIPFGREQRVAKILVNFEDLVGPLLKM